MDAWVGPRDEPRRYRLVGGIEPVASGGEGYVYRGRCGADDQPVAVKQLINVPPAAWARQADRVRVVGTVRHPRLGCHLEAFVGPHPFTGEVPDDEEFEVFYTVMAWVEGQDLTDAATGAELATVFGWVRDVAQAAGALHRHPTPTGLGIVHRDIKPSNVRVGEGGAVLVDFGIARPLDGSTMTRTAGAPGWMPPEAFASPDRVGARSDTWQVGGLAAWAVLGTAPGALVADDRRKQLEGALRPRVPAGAARPLARHIDRALAARPADRPADLDRWGDRLVALSGAGSRRGPRRTVAIASVLALVAVGAMGSAALAIARWRTTTGAPPVGTVSIPTGAFSPYDFGEVVTVEVALADPAPPAGRIVIEPMSGDRAAAGASSAAADIVAGRQALTFVVEDLAGGVPTVVDRLVVRTVSPDGTARDTQSEPVRLTFAPAVPGPERCTAYDPARVTVESSAGSTTRVMSGAVVITTVTSRPNGDLVAEVARQADAVCLLGLPEDPRPPVQYWRRGHRLVGLPAPAARPVNGDCEDYDPATVRLGEHEGEVLAGPATSLVMAQREADAAQAAAVARHYHRQCVIGKSGGDITDLARPTVTYWQ